MNLREKQWPDGKIRWRKGNPNKCTHIVDDYAEIIINDEDGLLVDQINDINQEKEYSYIFLDEFDLFSGRESGRSSRSEECNCHDPSR